MASIRTLCSLGLISAGLTLLACGGSTVVDGAGSGGQGGSSSGSGATTTSGPSSGSGGCEAFSNCCDDATGAEVAWYCQGEEPVCPEGASWPGPEGCMPEGAACSSSADCGADEYCDFPDDLCGAGLPGSCEPRPNGCGTVYDPVCTCDGSIAGNACDGAANGSDVSNAGGCEVPFDTFACGPKLCASQTEYCRLAVSDVGGEPSVYSCHPLPSGCAGNATCGCLSGEPCGDICEQLPSGELQLICPGG
jgi:hypothetical protein